MKLFRPTGLCELQLVLERELTAWPPRLLDQPIFYPVLNVGYAEQIARDWNAKSDERAGYVTEFVLDDAYGASFERRVVGANRHEELWVSAEALDELNTHIAAPIRSFFGAGFSGLIPNAGALRGQAARDQLATLAELSIAGEPALVAEVALTREAIFLHLPYWQSLDLPERVLAAPVASVLGAVQAAWFGAFPKLPLPVRASSAEVRG
jgi:hypothetical protein